MPRGITRRGGANGGHCAALKQCTHIYPPLLLYCSRRGTNRLMLDHPMPSTNRNNTTLSLSPRHRPPRTNENLEKNQRALCMALNKKRNCEVHSKMHGMLANKRNNKTWATTSITNTHRTVTGGLSGPGHGPPQGQGN